MPVPRAPNPISGLSLRISIIFSALSLAIAAYIAIYRLPFATKDNYTFYARHYCISTLADASKPECHYPGLGAYDPRLVLRAAQFSGIPLPDRDDETAGLKGLALALLAADLLAVVMCACLVFNHPRSRSGRILLAIVSAALVLFMGGCLGKSFGGLRELTDKRAVTPTGWKVGMTMGFFCGLLALFVGVTMLALTPVEGEKQLRDEETGQQPEPEELEMNGRERSRPMPARQTQGQEGVWYSSPWEVRRGRTQERGHGNGTGLTGPSNMFNPAPVGAGPACDAMEAEGIGRQECAPAYTRYTSNPMVPPPAYDKGQWKASGVANDKS